MSRGEPDCRINPPNTNRVISKKTQLCCLLLLGIGWGLEKTEEMWLKTEKLDV